MLSFAFYCKLSCSNMLPLLSSDDSTLVCCSCGSVLSQVCTHCSKTFFPATVSCSCCVPNLSQKLGFDAAFAEAVKEQAPIWVAPQMTTPPRPGQAQTSSRLAAEAASDPKASWCENIEQHLSKGHHRELAGRLGLTYCDVCRICPHHDCVKIGYKVRFSNLVLHWRKHLKTYTTGLQAPPGPSQAQTSSRLTAEAPSDPKASWCENIKQHLSEGHHIKLAGRPDVTYCNVCRICPHHDCVKYKERFLNLASHYWQRHQMRPQAHQCTLCQFYFSSSKELTKHQIEDNCRPT